MGHAPLTHVEAVDATCFENGNIEYWYCEACGYAWLDAEGVQSTNLKSVVLPMGHAPLTHVEAKDATCTENGNIEYWYCEVCGYAWLDAEGIQSTNLKSVVLPAPGHTGYEADYQCDTCSGIIAPEADSVLTIEQALTLGALYEKNTYTAGKYYVTGVITEIKDAYYGNMYIEDAEGNSIYVYGVNKNGDKYNFIADKPVIGDTVTLYGVIGYYSAPQMSTTELVEFVAHEHDYSEATCKVLATCSICGGTTGDFADHDYVDGVCSVCGNEKPAEGVTIVTDDFATLSGSTSYASGESSNGWVYSNAAILNASTFDSTLTTKAVCINGKTSAVGSIVSPTLTAGVASVSFNYGNSYSESNGVDLTITITKADGTTVSTTLDNDDVTKNTPYTFTWNLDEPVTGDCTITITNNSPTNSTSNKDRTSIWNIVVTSPVAE